MEVPKVNIPFKKYLSLLTHGVSRFQIALTLIVIALVLGIALNSVANLVDPTADENQVNLQLADLQNVEFDEDAIEAIEQLRASGVKIDSDFVNSRDNPFSEN